MYRDDDNQGTVLPTRIGVFGAGAMTMKRHLPAFARLREEGLCDIKSICDINIDAARAAAKSFAIPNATHTAADIIGRDDIDAIFIFAPADIHYRLGLEVLRSKKHLFVEKPPAQTTAQLLEMMRNADSRGLIAAAGFNRRFQRNIAEIVRRARPESLQSAEAVFNKPNASTPVPFGMRTWLGVNSIHALDVLCFVMGERPTALWSFSNGGSAEVSENFSAVIEWGDRHAVFSANNSAGSRLERYAFHGYGISYTADDEGFRSYRENGEGDSIVEGSSTKESMYEEFRVFFESIHTGKKPINALDRSLPALHLVERIEAGHRGSLDWSFVDSEPAPSPAEKEDVGQASRAASAGRRMLVLNPATVKADLPRLAENFSIVHEDEVAQLSERERTEVVGAIAGGSGRALTPALLESLPSLAVLAVVGASVKNWGADAALARGVALINTADVYADAVAEFIVMQSLVGLRRASLSHEAMRHGGWGFSIPTRKERILRILRSLMRIPGARAAKRLIMPNFASAPLKKRPSSRMLAGRTVGIVGWGEITKKTIPLFAAFGADVRVHSEYLSEEVAVKFGVRKATLELTLQSDIVSMQRGLSSRTARAFGTAEINALRPGTVFVNSARAGLVDSRALVERLRQGDIFACLDVFDAEPLPERDELRRLPNVFLTSHIAGSIHATEGLLEKANRQLVDKLVAYFNGSAVDTIHAGKLENMT